MSDWKLEVGSRTADPLDQFASLFYAGKELFRFAAATPKLLWTAKDGWLPEEEEAE